MGRRLHSCPSFFGGLQTRELHGLKASPAALRLPYLRDLSSDCGGRGRGVISVEHSGNFTPPLALSFCKTLESSHLLAISDEDGYVSIYDTNRHLPNYSSCREKSAEARVSEWIAHNNAIFDVCWIKDGSQILTASGDQTIRIWSVDNRKCIGTLSGHTGSVKSLSYHSSNPQLLVSGSRDGSFALWDLRCDLKSPDAHGEVRFMSSAVVREAHSPIRRRKTRSRAKAALTSITSVLYLKDDVTIATAGAADNVVKLWDTRNLETPLSGTSLHVETLSGKEGAKHGISCLSQDLNGAYIAASCMDNRIYLYNVLHLNKGPAKVYGGSKIESFFVKSAVSPDGAHILGGSSDGNVYLWQVEKSQSDPIILEGHEGETTAVDWCVSEVGKIATSSDDFTVRVWNMERRDCTNTSSPTVVRKRVTAPGIESRRLVMGEQATSSTDACGCGSAYGELPDGAHSPLEPRALDFGTPESGKKRGFGLFQEEALQMQKSPEGQTSSPSSVLNPPSLKRRTIRDYFGSTS